MDVAQGQIKASLTKGFGKITKTLQTGIIAEFDNLWILENVGIK